ncbi:hypothetical protein [Amycolatopsis sulphurea]|nr:hypothetical protein [Amycolatopsis sulphurea]
MSRDEPCSAGSHGGQFAEIHVDTERADCVMFGNGLKFPFAPLPMDWGQ